MEPAVGDLGSVSWDFSEKLVRGRLGRELKLIWVKQVPG